jgi:hypothetical protein
VSDVIMGAGHSLVHAGSPRSEGEELVLEIPVRLLEAILVGRSDGLAVMEEGSPHDRNHYFHSREAWGGEPWLEVETGAPRPETPPPPPGVTVAPAPRHADLDRGAVRVAVAPEREAWAWRVHLDGAELEPWQVPWPAPGDSTVFHLLLGPEAAHRLEVTTVDRAGAASPPTSLEFRASAALSVPTPLPPPATLRPAGAAAPSIWAVPGLVAVSPLTGRPLDDGLVGDGRDPARANPIWDGLRVEMIGRPGETVSFQLCLRRPADGGPARFAIRSADLRGPDGTLLSRRRIEMARIVPVPDEEVGLRPAYLLPLAAESEVDFAGDVRVESVHVDLHLPATASPGEYEGELVVHRRPGRPRWLPLRVRVQGPALVDRLGFRVELNAYRIPARPLDWFAMAQRHRCVFTPWVLAPRLRETPDGPRLDWDDYDAVVGPLLDGSAFTEGPRPGVPLESIYLPFDESWPTEITPTIYDYPEPWPGRGDPDRLLFDHHEKAPPLQDALDPIWVRRFARVQDLFRTHFDSRGWSVDAQCFFGAKLTHRTRYGMAVWWNTDEPLYGADWDALRWFLSRWREGIPSAARDRWPARADISRPEWMEGRLLPEVDVVYAAQRVPEETGRRMRDLARRHDLRWRTYGELPPEDAPPSSAVDWVLGAWRQGAQGALVWQSLGDTLSWRDRDQPGLGNALLVPGPGGGPPVVADLRLKALRDGQQLIEALTVLALREGLERPQIGLLVDRFCDPRPASWWNPQRDPGFAGLYGRLDAVALERLRRSVLERLAAPPP